MENYRLLQDKGTGLWVLEGRLGSCGWKIIGAFNTQEEALKAELEKLEARLSEVKRKMGVNN